MGRFDDLMAAISFAEAGEHETAREFLKRSERVLLAVSDRKEDRSVFGNIFMYAVNICKRIKADLDIIRMKTRRTKGPNLEALIVEDLISGVKKEGIKCRTVERKGCMREAILNYTKRKGEKIIFVIIGATYGPDGEHGGRGKFLPDEWKDLMCPLVVVTGSGKPLAANNTKENGQMEIG